MDMDRHSKRILIVDDEPFVLRTTAHVLKSMGFSQILAAQSGFEAIQSINAANPSVDLVMLDLNMPDMDGIEMLRRLGDQGYRGEIMLFSGEENQILGMAESLARARNLTIIGTIAKPVEGERLSALLANCTTPGDFAANKRDLPPVTPQMLEAAIEARELEPWFQPKIAIDSRQPAGVEMLARWPHDTLGLIYPDAFIPIAESSGLIDRMTFLLVEKAVRMNQQWLKQGIKLKLAVNISMDSLRNLDFPQRLDKVVHSAGGNLNTMQLEVTESRLIEDQVASLDVLLRLRLKKVHLSLDDFGTGYSNLSQLRDLPFDELKLDRSYVREGENWERTAAILESSVEMAKKLGMTIVAEGVETLEDWRRVELLGCDQVQGWFTAKPMPGGHIPQWIEAWPETSRKLFSSVPETQ
jgi:EAL domain-containing protein (putative c-di-GMP-specific phosphodiesterase class I)/ActR/RegA family two-component response regulator